MFRRSHGNTCGTIGAITIAWIELRSKRTIGTIKKSEAFTWKPLLDDRGDRYDLNVAQLPSFFPEFVAFHSIMAATSARFSCRRCKIAGKFDLDAAEAAEKKKKRQKTRDTLFDLQQPFCSQFPATVMLSAQHRHVLPMPIGVISSYDPIGHFTVVC